MALWVLFAAQPCLALLIFLSGLFHESNAPQPAVVLPYDPDLTAGFFLAVKQNATLAIKALLPRLRLINVNYFDSDDLSALDYAVRNQNLPLSEFLCSIGVITSHSLTISQEFARMARAGQFKDLVDMWQTYSSVICVNLAEGGSSYTPLDYCIERSDAEMALFLCSIGGRPMFHSLDDLRSLLPTLIIKCNPLAWNIEATYDWVKNVTGFGVPKAMILKEAGVDGVILLGLTEDKLYRDYGIPRGPGAILQQAIQELKSEA